MNKIFIIVVCMCESIFGHIGHSSSRLSPTIAQGIFIKNKFFEPGELLFEDDFQYFDSNKWGHDGNNQAHANEFQLYTNSSKNSYVKDGILHIRPTIDTSAKGSKFSSKNFYPIRSARISTKESFSFMYGIVEVVARVPSGDWLFPAIWLMPRDASYGDWPVSGEIDIMESRGNKNLTDFSGHLVGVQQFGTTLHWGPNKTLDEWRVTHFTKNNNTRDFSADFHSYKLVWAPDNLSFYVDNEEIGSIAPPNGGFWEMGNFTKDENNPWTNGTKVAPFDKQFYLILNLAVGGTSFFSDTYINQGGKPWNNSSPNAALDFWEGRDQWLPTWNWTSDEFHFLIDSVRIWAS